MIPALATIIAAYVTFRCLSITLDALNRLSTNIIIRVATFVIVLLAAIGTNFINALNLMAILGAAETTTY
jgi:hypothetical protein